MATRSHQRVRGLKGPSCPRRSPCRLGLLAPTAAALSTSRPDPRTEGTPPPPESRIQMSKLRPGFQGLEREGAQPAAAEGPSVESPWADGPAVVRQAASRGAGPGSKDHRPFPEHQLLAARSPGTGWISVLVDGRGSVRGSSESTRGFLRFLPHSVVGFLGEAIKPCRAPAEVTGCPRSRE